MSTLEYWKHIGIRFFWFLFFTGIIITTCIVVENNAPEQNNYLDTSFHWEEPYLPVELQASGNNISLDGHSHTILTPRQNLLWHISMGYNACIITDHGRIDRAIEARDIARSEYNNLIKVIVGEEYSTDRIHMNFINISVVIPVPDNPTDEDLQEAINDCHAQGGLVSVNHYPRTSESNPDVPTRTQLLEWGVDYVEIFNRNSYDEESYENWVNNSGGFAAITGTDMHTPGTVYAWTGLNVTEFTEEAIFIELKNNQTAIFNNSIGYADLSEPIPNLTYRLIEPLIKIGQLFKTFQLDDDTFDWFGIGIFACYMVGIFLIAEGIRFGNKKLWEKMNQRRNTPINK
jgi:hypothetical protein